MRIVNTIVVFDVYTVVDGDDKDGDTGIAAVMDAIKSGDLPPSEQVALPVVNERSIRQKWLTEKPFVGAGVSDGDFETLKGKTTIDIFNMLHTKEGPK